MLKGNVCLLKFRMAGFKLVFLPGQYLIFKAPKDMGFVLRLYSIASSAKVSDGFEILLEVIPSGAGSSFLNSMEINKEVEFTGPAGQFTIKDPLKKKIFLVTGTGIAPVRSMILSGTENYELYWGMKTFLDLYLLEEIKHYENKTICLSKETGTLPFVLNGIDCCFGHVDWVFDRKNAKATKEQLAKNDYYICGNREMVQSTSLFLMNKGVPKENIIIERF